MWVIGSGLSEDGAASQAMDLVLANVGRSKNLVVDGSALNLLAKENKKDLPVVTSHPASKEWERLSGLVPDQIVSTLKKTLGEFQAGTILVAKRSINGCLSR